LKFQIDIKMRKIVRDRGLVIVYCDKPRALGEVFRHNHSIHPFAMTVWGQGVTLMPADFLKVKHLFKGIEVVQDDSKD